MTSPTSPQPSGTPPSQKTTKCPICDGRGYPETHRFVTCPRCHGRGTVPISAESSPPATPPPSPRELALKIAWAIVREGQGVAGCADQNARIIQPHLSALQAELAGEKSAHEICRQQNGANFLAWQRAATFADGLKAELAMITSRLRKTADGVAVLPGDTVYLNHRGTPFAIVVQAGEYFSGGRCCSFSHSPYIHHMKIEETYSTSAAASPSPAAPGDERT